MRLLITGTGRSGTQWAAEAIRAAGVDCGHEIAFFPTNIDIDGDWKAESSWLAVPWLNALEDTYVVHLVRHPLKTIASRAKRGTFAHDRNGHSRYAHRHCPGLTDAIAGRTTHGWDRRTRIRAAAVFWVNWNRMVTRFDERIRLEDVTPEDVTRWVRHVDPAARLDELPPPSHQGPGRRWTVTWDEVAGVPGLLDLAKKYGYRR